MTEELMAVADHVMLTYAGCIVTSMVTERRYFLVAMTFVLPIFMIGAAAGSLIGWSLYVCGAALVMACMLAVLGYLAFFHDKARPEPEPIL